MNIPKLRFKEFNDEYRTYFIKDLGDVITGTTPSTSDKENYGDEFLWASPIDMGLHKYINDTKNKLSKKGFKKVRTIPKDSILVTCIGSTIGKMGVASKEMATNQQINTLICNDNFENNYMYYCIGYNFPRFLNKISFQAVPIISKSEFEKLLLTCSINKQEQTKVANFLSLLDKKIELQTKKIEDLKLFKSGQIVKKIKSLDFKEVELKKFGYFISSNSIGKEKITISGVPLILYGDLYTKYSEEITKINQYIKDNEKYIKSEINDLLFPTSTTVDAISLISPSVINIANVVYGGDLLIFKTISSNVNPKFLSYQINHFKRKEFAKKAQGTTIIHIHANDLLSSKVKIPDLNTQILIAHFGNKINKKIELEILKLNKLKSLKKGLMQNLFV